MPRVVILDDSEGFATMVAAVLSAENEVVTGQDGVEGLRLCLEAPTDLLITDIGMPRMDGVNLLRELKRYPQTKTIPVIVLTASHFNTVPRAKFEKDPQVVAILHKPCHLTELANKVRSVVANRPGPAA